MSVSAILPEKSRENKKCEEEEQKKKNKNKKKKNDKILGIWQHFKMAVTWLYATFLISMCSLCRGQHAGFNI